MGEWITASVELTLPATWTDAQRVIRDMLHDTYDPEQTEVDGIVRMHGYIEANYGDTSELTNLLDRWAISYRVQHDGKYEIPGQVTVRPSGEHAHSATCAGEMVALGEAEVRALGSYEEVLRHFEIMSWCPTGKDATALLGHPDPAAEGNEEG